MKCFTLLFLMISLSAWAQEDVYSEYIADNYQAGSALIYDCQEKHWTCVSVADFDECREKRIKAIAQEDLMTLPCAAIAYFPSKKSCFQRQLFMTTHNHGERFCIKDEWKLKASQD